MEIRKVDSAGFCFGVRRAINIAFNAAKNGGDTVYTLGSIIHNPQVVKRLSEEGVRTIQDIDQGDIKRLIIRSHGVSAEVFNKASKRSIDIIDATCPFVKKAQKYAHSLKRDGYQVVIVGNGEHPEVKSILSYAGDDAIVVDNPSALEGTALKKKVGIIAQTTQRHTIFREVVLKCLDKAREIKVYDTICDSTYARQEATKKLAGEVDLILVVGGRCSANTTQLANICKQIGTKTFHIEVADEIKEDWFNGVERVGVTGGASTPGWIIDDVVKRLKDIDKKRFERR